MENDRKEPEQGFLYAMAAAVFGLSAWGTSFSHSCQSDGCIGMVYPFGASLVALVVQVLVVVPLYVARSKTKGEPTVAAGKWVFWSLAAFLVPLAFAKI